MRDSSESLSLNTLTLSVIFSVEDKLSIKYIPVLRDRLICHRNTGIYCGFKIYLNWNILIHNVNIIWQVGR